MGGMNLAAPFPANAFDSRIASGEKNGITSLPSMILQARAGVALYIRVVEIIANLSNFRLPGNDRIPASVTRL
jgi:hypothetical protein